MLLLIALQDLLQDAEAALKAKDYRQAVKLFDEAEKQSRLSATALYFRGSAHQQLGAPLDAIRDYAAAVRASEHGKNIYKRSQEKLFEICQQHCSLNCARNFSTALFPTTQHYAALQQLYKKRKQFLLADNPPLEELKAIGKQCSQDAEIQQKLLNSLIQNSDFAGAREAADRLKQVFPSKSTEVQQLFDIYTMLEHINSGNYTGLERSAQRASRSQPDEVIFSQFYKLGHALRELSAEIEGFTPSVQISTEKATSGAKRIHKIKDLPQRVFKSVGSRVKTLTAAVFSIKEEFVQEFDCYALEQRLIRQISGFSDIFDIIANKPGAPKADDLPSETAVQKYVKALLYYYDVDQQLKTVIQTFQLKQDISDIIDAADKKLNLIYTLLKDAWGLKDSDDSFPQMKKFVDDLNKLADQVHAYHMKALNPDLYRILGVSRQASDTEIRKAYFKLARKFHPDMIPKNTSEDEKKRMNREFQRIADAYDTLVDPAKRDEYNKGQHNAAERQSAEQYHMQRKQLAQQMFMRGAQGGFGGQQFQQFGGQGFDFGGFDPFQFFNFGGFNQGQGGQRQGQGQGQGQGGRQRIVFNFNGQEFFM